MPRSKEDWEKTRRNGQHLTEAEIAQAKAWFIAGLTQRETARRLGCSTRAIQRQHAIFRAAGVLAKPKLNRVAKPDLNQVATLRPDRFYKSDFEL